MFVLPGQAEVCIPSASYTQETEKSHVTAEQGT
jgi:hypothetical protein